MSVFDKSINMVTMDGGLLQPMLRGRSQIKKKKDKYGYLIGETVRSLRQARSPTLATLLIATQLRLLYPFTILLVPQRVTPLNLPSIIAIVFMLSCLVNTYNVILHYN